MVRGGETETARAIDSLKCNVSVQETLLNYANKVVETEKKKVAVVAHDSKIVLNSLLEDIQEVRERSLGVGWCRDEAPHLIQCINRHYPAILRIQTKSRGEREEAWLRFLVSKYEVAQHGMERDKMHDNIKYNAAVDSLSQQKQLIGQLMRYMEADRQVGRQIVGQNAVLTRELQRMADVARSTSVQLKKATGAVDALKREIGMKDDMLRQMQNQMMLTRTQYDERMHMLDSDLRRAQSRANEPHSDTTFLDTMMKECGLTSKDDVVRRVQAYSGLEEEVSRLKKACQEQEKKRKEAEKTVKEQKKDLTAKNKRIASLEESLKAQAQMTPVTAPKAVTHAMQAVGNLVDQLGASPLTEKRSSTTKRTRRSTVNDDDVSHWNPDMSDKENASNRQVLGDANKALAFATGKNSAKKTKRKGAVVASSGAAPPKRRLLSVTSTRHAKPQGGGFSIPKLSQNT